MLFGDFFFSSDIDECEQSPRPFSGDMFQIQRDRIYVNVKVATQENGKMDCTGNYIVKYFIQKLLTKRGLPPTNTKEN